MSDNQETPEYVEEFDTFDEFDEDDFGEPDYGDDYAADADDVVSPQRDTWKKRFPQLPSSDDPTSANQH